MKVGFGAVVARGFGAKASLFDIKAFYFCAVMSPRFVSGGRVLYNRSNPKTTKSIIH